MDITNKILICSLLLAQSAWATSIREVKIKEVKERVTPKEARELPGKYGCSIQIDAGSHASGIDGSLFKEVILWVDRSGDIISAYQWSWGKEGEKSICLIPRDKADTQKLVDELKSNFEGKAKKGSLTIRPL